jgi:putative ABC transport system ATP-binding protein
MAHDQRLGQVGRVSAAVEADDLFRFYHAGDDETLALRGVSLTAEAGEVVAVTGPSGSGKSTLLACLAGLDEPDGGTVRIGGERLSRRSEEERAALRARRIGMLFQHDNLVGHLTVGQNVATARALARGAEPAPSASAVMSAAGIAHRAGHLPRQLSGGEQARAGLAVAIANDPVVLLADEPTGELDDATTDRVLQLLRERAEAGTAVVVVTHDPAVSGWADRELKMRDGRLEA